MEQTPDFLDGDQDRNCLTNDLEQINTLVEEWQERKKAVKDAEQQLKVLKQDFNEVDQQLLPEFLLTRGITKIALKDGSEVRIQENISVTLKNELKFFKFLEDRDEAEIVKLNLAFSKMPTDDLVNLYGILEENGYDYSEKRGVHSQTLKKYFKDILGVGQDDQEEGIKKGKYLRKTDVEDFAKTYVYHTTKLKESK